MSKTRFLSLLFLSPLFLLTAISAWAQITNVTPDQAPPTAGVGHDYVKMLNETVNPSNGAVSIRISVPVPSSRGFTLPFAFGYDSNAALHLGSTMSDNSGILAKSGWSYVLPALFFQQHVIQYVPQGGGGQSTCYYYNDYVFQDPSGTTHNLGLAVFQPNNTVNCTYLPGQQSKYGPTVLTGSDPWVQAVSPGWVVGKPYPAVTVTDASGTVYYFSNTSPGNGAGGWASLPDSIEDRNGNMIKLSGNTSPVSIPDTAGRTAILITGFGSSGNTVAVSGLVHSYQVTWGTSQAHWLFNGVTTTDDGSQTCTSPGTGLYNASSTPVITAIELPNNQSYKFSYETSTPTLGTPPYYSGLLNKITYPTGGYVRYVYNTDSLAYPKDFYPDSTGSFVCHEHYDSIAVQDRFVSFDGTSEPLHQHFAYYTDWVQGPLSSGQRVWDYKTTTVTTYVGSSTYTTTYKYYPAGINANPGDGAFVISNGNLNWGPNVGSYAPVEGKILYQTGTAPLTTLQTTYKSWQNQYQLNCELRNPDTTSYYAGEFYQYAAGGMMTDKREYDFNQVPLTACPYNMTGSTYPSTIPMRETIVTPKSFSPTPIYPSAPSILNRPASVVINDQGTKLAETDYVYDTYASGIASVPSGVSGHDTSYSTSFTNRGNATSKVVLCLGCSPATPSTTTYGYDATGQLTTVIDPCGNASCADMVGSSNHTTTFNYTDNYDSNPASPTNTYVKTITNPLGQSATFQYAYGDGQLIQSTDPNNQITKYEYETLLRRLAETDFPDGGETSISYNDNPYTSSSNTPNVTTTKVATPDPNITTITYFDGAGHTISSNVNSATSTLCPTGNHTDTTYDGLGRIATVSNPYCISGDQTSGLTTYTYDALNRTTSIMHPDSTTILTTYLGRATQVQDEGYDNSGDRITRISQTDGLGRLASVCEVAPGPFVGANGASTASLIGLNGTPASCSLDLNPSSMGFVTTYTYTAFDNLKGVTQGGMSRSFTYDSLSRLTSAANPESGLINYKYDLNGNLSSKTDARPVTVTYTYDVLNRNTLKSYSDGTPSATFLYDVGPSNLGAIPYPIGRLVEASAGCAFTINGYDRMGRVAYQLQQIPTNCTSPYPYANIPYTYDLAGNITTASDGEFITFTYGYDGAGRVTSLMSSQSSGTQYPASLLSAVVYNGAGQVVSDTLGDTETEVFSFDHRLRPVSAVSTYNNTTRYSYNVTYAPNGDVLTSADSVNGNWTYSYDQFNRLVGSNNGTTTFSYVYDRFGNRWQQNPSGFLAMFNGNKNQMDGYSYDAAGNLKNDGVNSYTYDAENRITSFINLANNTLTGSYVYDGLGQRVGKTSAAPNECDASGGTVFYIRDLTGHVEVFTQSGVNQCHDEIYVGNRHLATYAGGTNFVHADWVGTERRRVISSYVNTPAYDQVYTSYPFGDGMTGNQSTYASSLHFTGKQHDLESGLENFDARYYSSSMGRFMIPDWAAKPASVPYATFGNPQSLNLYSLVENNPTTMRDQDGHNCPVCDAVMTSAFEGATDGAILGPEGLLGGFGLGVAIGIVSEGGGRAPAGYVPGGNLTDEKGNSIFRMSQSGSNGNNSAAPAEQPGTADPNPGPDGPYKRPNNATTKEQRESVQGKPCATCGATGQKNNADHTDPLVEQHYRGGIDEDKMRSPGAVQPQCSECSNQQGGYLSQFSKAMKKLFFGDQQRQ
jgi:RHS repeat-associated protein